MGNSDQIMLITLLLATSFSVSAKNEKRFPASDQAKGILYHLGKDGVVTLFYGVNQGNKEIPLQGAFDNAVENCAKKFSKKSCDNLNNFDITIHPEMFTDED